MKKYPVFFFCCLIMFVSAGSAFAQFTGPGPGSRRQDAAPGVQAPAARGAWGQGGHFGSWTVTAEQARSMPNRAQVALSGKILYRVSPGRYVFHDPSGDIVVRINPVLLSMVSAGPNDQVEISGRIRRSMLNWYAYHLDVQFIRRAITQ